MRFSEESRAAMRRNLMQRGEKLATLLAEVLAGKDKESDLAALGLEKPGMRPEEILRAALDQVESRRKLLDAGDERFGRCDVCGADLGEAAVMEVPWADRCPTDATA